MAFIGYVKATNSFTALEIAKYEYGLRYVIEKVKLSTKKNKFPYLKNPYYKNGYEQKYYAVFGHLRK
jgi:hypothetical protein